MKQAGCGGVVARVHTDTNGLVPWRKSPIIAAYGCVWWQSCREGLRGGALEGAKPARLPAAQGGGVPEPWVRDKLGRQLMLRMLARGDGVGDDIVAAVSDSVFVRSSMRLAVMSCAQRCNSWPSLTRRLRWRS